MKSKSRMGTGRKRKKRGRNMVISGGRRLITIMCLY